MLSFGMQATMTVTPRLRGGIPSLYIQPTPNVFSRLHGSADEVENDMLKDREVWQLALALLRQGRRPVGFDMQDVPK